MSFQLGFQVPNVFPMSFQLVIEVSIVFPNLFSIALHFVLYGFLNVVLLEPNMSGANIGAFTMLLCLE
jgi:hypothetical protein